MSNEADNTTRKQDYAWLKEYGFKPGQSGNPAGRPKGSKNKLSEDFVAELCRHFEEKGALAIEKVYEERPADYLKIIASVIPKDLIVKTAPLEEMSDDELVENLDRVRALCAALIEGAPGAGSPKKGRDKAPRSKPN